MFYPIAVDKIDSSEHLFEQSFTLLMTKCARIGNKYYYLLLYCDTTYKNKLVLEYSFHLSYNNSVERKNQHVCERSEHFFPEKART